MKSAPLPPDEHERLAALLRTRLLDSEAEVDFDDLARLAATVCGTPIALVSLVDADRQWFKARVGLGATETPRDVAFCAHAILEPGKLFVVEDAHEDERFADNPLVTGEPKVRFYAGVPLPSSEGLGLGTLCVIDHVPRSLTPAQVEALQILQRQASSLVRLRELASATDQLLEGWDLLESISDMVQSLNPDGRFRYVNRSWLATLGYGLDEVSGLRFLDLIAPDERALGEAHLERLARGEALEDVVLTLVAKRGGQVRVCGTANAALVDGAPALTRWVLRDVTREFEREAERELQNRALRESEARHRGTLEAVLDAVLTLDRRGVIVDCNPATERVFGYTPEELVGVDVAQLTAEPDRERQGSYLETSISGLAGERHEIVAQRKDGSTFPAELAVSKVSLAGGHLFTWVVEDITARKDAERAKDDFVANLSHELRTPLTSIRGSLGLLEGGVLGELAPPVLEVLRIARTNSERLIRLINELLDFEKIRANRLPLNLQFCETQRLVTQALEAVAGMAAERRIALRHEVVADLPLRVDPDRVTQILANLLSNAIKFSPEGKEVLLHAGPDPAGKVRFEVRDQGPGIPPEGLAGLFERFTQLDGTATRAVGGTGLGLAISRALAEQHGGAIGAESTPGVGSTFWVSFPSLRRDPSTRRLERNKPVDALLLVEDDPGVARLLMLQLDSEDYDLVRVKSLAEAEAYLTQWRPMAVLIDVELPDGNGLALLDQLGQDRSGRGVPAIVVSGSERGDLSHPVLVDWLVKPYDEVALQRAVRLAVHRGPARVLVLEDDADLRSVLIAQLEELGLECLEAGDGMSGLALARSSRPDLIVLDVELPRLSGFEFVDVLRAELAGQRTPLLVYSGRELNASDKRLLTLGETRHLTKGRTSKEQFLEAVRELLPDEREAS